jgi:hypothetical protein
MFLFGLKVQVDILHICAKVALRLEDCPDILKAHLLK